MRYFGFYQECNIAGCSDFADLGQVSDRGVSAHKILGPGWVVTSNRFDQRVDESGSVDVRANIVNLYTAGTESIVLMHCIFANRCFKSQDSSEPPVDWTVPVLLVKSPIVPVELSVTFGKGFDAVTGKAQAKASLRSSDGIWRDVTKDVIWSISGLSGETHIGNSPTNSGEAQYRGTSKTPIEFTVTADYPWYISPHAGQSGHLRASAFLYGNENVAASPLASLVMSPANKRTNQYPLNYSLIARGVLKNGRAVDQTSGVTWTSTDTEGLLTISPSGNVTVNNRPATRKAIQITATKDGATGKAYLVLDN